MYLESSWYWYIRASATELTKRSLAVWTERRAASILAESDVADDLT